MSAFDWVGHGVLFFLAGFTYWLMRARRHNLGSILTIALPVAGVYFLGWWALLTFIVGVLFAAQTFSKAVHAGKDPFSNPWRQPPPMQTNSALLTDACPSALRASSGAAKRER